MEILVLIYMESLNKFFILFFLNPRSPIGSLGVAPAIEWQNFLEQGTKNESFIKPPRNRIGRQYKTVVFLATRQGKLLDDGGGTLSQLTALGQPLINPAVPTPPYCFAEPPPLDSAILPTIANPP